MSYSEWREKTSAFKQIDVRGIQGNFFANAVGAGRMRQL